MRWAIKRKISLFTIEFLAPKDRKSKINLKRNEVGREKIRWCAIEWFVVVVGFFKMKYDMPGRKFPITSSDGCGLLLFFPLRATIHLSTLDVVIWLQGELWRHWIASIANCIDLESTKRGGQSSDRDRKVQQDEAKDLYTVVGSSEQLYDTNNRKLTVCSSSPSGSTWLSFHNKKSDRSLLTWISSFHFSIEKREMTRVESGWVGFLFFWTKYNDRVSNRPKKISYT